MNSSGNEVLFQMKHQRDLSFFASQMNIGEYRERVLASSVVQEFRKSYGSHGCEPEEDFAGSYHI